MSCRFNTQHTPSWVAEARYRERVPASERGSMLSKILNDCVSRSECLSVQCVLLTECFMLRCRRFAVSPSLLDCLFRLHNRQPALFMIHKHLRLSFNMTHGLKGACPENLHCPPSEKRPWCFAAMPPPFCIPCAQGRGRAHALRVCPGVWMLRRSFVILRGYFSLLVWVNPPFHWCGRLLFRETSCRV